VVKPRVECLTHPLTRVVLTPLGGLKSQTKVCAT
jgi:hypothetical protein